MAQIAPFKALRPNPSAAEAEVKTLYDVLNTAEAKKK